MRVAAHFPGVAAEAGGVSTFENDIFRAFLDLANASSHEFIFYLDEVGHFPSLPKNASVVRMRHDRRWKTRLRRVLDGRITLRSWFEKSLKEQRAEFVYFATNAALPCDVPMMVTTFDYQQLIQPWFPEVSADGVWEARDKQNRSVIPRAAFVITPNETGKQQLMQYFALDEQRVLTIPHPTPMFALDNADKTGSTAVLQKFGITQPYIFYPAQFWAHKNHVLILDTLALLAGKDAGAPHAVFSGSDKGNLAHIKALAAKFGIQDRVHFVGFISVSDLIDLYKNAAALTYVSLFGPENLPPLEAFALGCPVIHSDIPGARNQLGDAVVYVDPTDAAQLANAISELASKPDLRRDLIKKGRARSRQWTAKDYASAVMAAINSFERTRRLWC